VDTENEVRDQPGKKKQKERKREVKGSQHLGVKKRKVHAFSGEKFKRVDGNKNTRGGGLGKFKRGRGNETPEKKIAGGSTP